MPRIIDRHVQLVAQSNDCCLLAYPEMKVRFERAWDEMEFTRNPEEVLYLQQNGRSFANRSPWIGFYSHQWNIPLYHQKACLLHIHQGGYLAGRPYTFYSKRKDFYLHFINIKDRKNLNDFVRRKEDFCFFPNEQEIALLRLRYQEAIGTENCGFLFPIHKPTSKDIEKKENEDAKKIFDINMDFIWEKKEWLRALVESYRKGTMNLRELAVLNRSMTQVSEILLDQDDFMMANAEKSVNYKPWPDERGFDDVIGGKKVSDTKALVPAYRVYGHFALCCLEFFLAVRARKSLDKCQACKKYYEKSHGNQGYCSPKCKKKGASERSAKYRDNKVKIRPLK